MCSEPNSRIEFALRRRPDEVRTGSRYYALYLQVLRGYEIVGITHKPREGLFGSVRMSTRWRLRRVGTTEG